MAIGPKQYVSYNGVMMATEEYIKIRDLQERSESKNTTKQKTVIEEKINKEIKIEEPVIEEKKEQESELVDKPMTRQDAVRIYKAKVGKMPSPKWGIDEIMSKIQ